MEPTPLDRLDSFPYRHRISEVMTSPVVLVPPMTTLADAASRMDVDRISSVLVSGRDPSVAQGILTERDILKAVARKGSWALSRPVTEFMSSPVESLPADLFVYRAIGRMDRLGVRHLTITGADGATVGILTARQLLRQRAADALMMGDQVSTATDGAALAAVRDHLPTLARSLLAEGLAARDIAVVISATVRDLTARTVELAERSMIAEGHGPAPAPWCVMVLGSGGRGESLLAMDQDNALIHAGSDDDDDPWFAVVGERFTAILDEAGVPLCKGGVMARNPLWRGTLESWKMRVDGWIEKSRPDDLLSVDIFFDLHAVYGDRQFAEALRNHALDRARGARSFLRTLSNQLDNFSKPIGLFGGFKTDAGRLDLKIGGLFPITAGARMLALRYGYPETSTKDRLEHTADDGHIASNDAQALIDAQGLIQRLVLTQQLVDINAGLAPSTKVELAGISRDDRSALKGAMGHIDGIAAMVRDALSG